MAIANIVYGRGIKALGMGDVLWKTTGGSTMKKQLTLDSHTPDKNAHEDRADVSADKVSGTTDQTITATDPTFATGTATFDVSEATLTYSAVASGTVGGTIAYKDTGAAANDLLVCQNDFSGGNIVANGSDIEVSPSASGLFTITY